MKRRSAVSTAIAALLFTWIAIIVTNPLRRSEASIQSSLLKETPLGSSTVEVIRALEKKGFVGRLESTGVYKQMPGAKPEVVGVSSIRVLLGEYHSPLVTSVSAFFAFDEGKKLIDIWVWKTVDAP